MIAESTTMTSRILLNQLEPDGWDYRKIDNAFDIYQITLERHSDRNILNIHDERLKIVSTVYLNGQSIFIMTNKGTTDEGVLQHVLSTKEEGTERKVFVRQVPLTMLVRQPEKMRRLFGYRNRALVQLLINSTLNTPVFPEDEYSNITGRCYYFNPEWNEDVTKKIELIDFTIGQDMSLYPSVVTFTKERPKKDFPERIVLDRKRNVIRKPVGKESPEDIYYRHGEDGTHSSRAYDGTTLKFWEQSRMACMSRFFTAIKEELAVYVTLRFVCTEGEKIAVKELDPGMDHIPSILGKEGICLVDSVVLSEKEELSDDAKMQKLRDWITESRQSVLSSIKFYCQSNRITVREGSKDLYCPNIELVRPELFYKCNKTKKDPYVADDGIVCQHVTIPCATTGKAFTEELNVLLKELAIKADIREGRIRMVDWATYGVEDPVCFFIGVPLERGENTRPVRFKGMTIQPDGTFTTEQFTADVKNLLSLDSRQRQIVEMFFHSNFGQDYFDRNVEIVAFPQDMPQNALKIRRTNIRAMSDFEATRKAFESERIDVSLDVPSVLSAIEPFQWDDSESVREVYYRIVNELRGQDVVKKSQLLPLLYPEKKDGQKKVMICRRIKETIENTTGVVIRVSRSDAMEEILGTNIYRHIHLWEAKAYDQVDGQDEPPSVYNYIVGQFDKPNQSIATSPVVRQISRADGEAPVLSEIMPLVKMMQVGFVRMKNYTVLPFPAKYLREI